MSDVNVNEDPRAGLIEVAENRERGLVGTLVAWAFITWSQLCSSSVSISSRVQGVTYESSKSMSIGQFSNIFHYPHHSRLTYHKRRSEARREGSAPAEFVLIN